MRGKIYSNVFIRINRPDRQVIKGVGFESTQQMYPYTIFHPYDSEIYYEEEENLD
jgi:hypothetical protein